MIFLRPITLLLFLFVSFGGGVSIADEFAVGDAAKGERQFKKCMACHQVGEGAKNRVGPVLTGVIGRPAGTAEKFKYGKSLIAAGEGGLVWTEELIFEWLENPRDFLKTRLDDSKAKTKMTFRMKKADQRNDVIAYLKTFSVEE